MIYLHHFSLKIPIENFCSEMFDEQFKLFLQFSDLNLSIMIIPRLSWSFNHSRSFKYLFNLPLIVYL